MRVLFISSWCLKFSIICKTVKEVPYFLNLLLQYHYIWPWFEGCNFYAKYFKSPSFLIKQISLTKVSSWVTLHVKSLKLLRAHCTLFLMDYQKFSYFIKTRLFSLIRFGHLSATYSEHSFCGSSQGLAIFHKESMLKHKSFFGSKSWQKLIGRGGKFSKKVSARETF